MPITAKDITVSVPCLFPDERPIWMCRQTADHFGYQLRPYGLGATYSGWISIKIVRLKAEAESCPTSHLLYTDARDAFFLAGPEEVAEKYNALGAPPLLMSAQSDIFGTYAKWYEGIPWNMDEVFRYIGTPGLLCEAKALAGALGWMIDRMNAGGECDDDDPVHWNLYIKDHPGAVVLDHKCAIFMNCGSAMPHGQEMWRDVLDMRGGRVYNMVTDQWPVVLHFNGGYSSPENGKDDLILPFWEALGHRERRPK